MTLCGPARLARAYYHCPRCRRGHCPGDALWRLRADGLTPGAREAAGLDGLLEGFAGMAAEALPKPTGPRLAELTVERAAEAAGRQVGERLAAGEVFGPARPWDRHPDAAGAGCAYVSVDASGVDSRAPAGPRPRGA